MADAKISALPASTTPLAGTEVLPVVQGSTTKQVSVANLTAGRAVSASSLALTGSPLPVSSGGSGTATAFTAGSVIFAGASGTYSQSNTTFFWDSANNRLGLGTSLPGSLLTALGQSSFQRSGTVNANLVGPKATVLQVIGDSANNENSPGALAVVTPGMTTSTRGPQVYFMGSRATNAQLAAATYSALQANDRVGDVFFGGDNGVNVRAFGAQISGIVVSNWSSTNLETDLVISTCANGSAASTERFRFTGAGNAVVTGVGGLGYGTGSGGAVTQGTSRTNGVTLNKTNGAITLVSAAGTATWQTFTVTNSTVAATDTIIVNQKSGTDLYQIFVTNVAAGSFKITFATTGGTTTEQPIFNFAVIKAVTA